MIKNDKKNNDMRLNIATCKYCNNACIFCKADVTKREQPDINTVSRLLEENRNGCKSVIFTTGEPTLNNDLVEFIKLAKVKGYVDIRLITNGRKLADKSYLLDLVAAGLNTFNLSIHGHNSHVHDFITARPGSFLELLRGLAYLHKLKSKYDYKIISSTTVIKYNLPYLLDLLKVLFKFDIDEIILNPVVPTGNALKNKDVVLVRYSEFMEHYNKISNLLPAEKLNKIRIVGLPYCLADSKMIKNFGKTEGMILKESNERVVKLGDYYKEKRKDCFDCIYDNNCEGVWRNYIKIFGWQEFQPVIKKSD